MMLQREIVEHLKQKYLPGTRIKMLEMQDPYAPIPSGTEGVVECVDDVGQIHMRWNNGRCLAIVPGCDKFAVMEETKGSIDYD